MKKLLLAGLIAAASLPFTANADEPLSGLRYDYADVDVAIGRSKAAVDDREFSLKTRTISTAFSATVADYFYVAGSLASTTTDDRDVDDGRLLIIDDDTLDLTGRLGTFVPLSQNFDLVAEVGLLHSRMDQKSGGFSDYQAKKDENETDMMWKVGFRSVWMNAFEMNLDYARADNRSVWTLSGPMYVSDKLGIDIAYSRSKDKTDDNRSKTEAFSVGVRHYF